MNEAPQSKDCAKPDAHKKHLCFQMYEGIHLKDPDTYRAIVQNAQYRCEMCSRTACEAQHLCHPVKI